MAVWGCRTAWGGWPSRRRRPASAVSFHPAAAWWSPGPDPLDPKQARQPVSLSLELLEASENGCDPLGAGLNEDVCPLKQQRGCVCTLGCRIISSFWSFCCSTLKMTSIFWTVNCLDHFCKPFWWLFYRIFDLYERQLFLMKVATPFKLASVSFWCVLEMLLLVLKMWTNTEGGKWKPF